MDYILLLILWIVFVAGSVGYALSSTERRSNLLSHLRQSKRRASEANTPPRELSPGSNVDPFETADYRDTLPPSRRFALKAAAPDIFPELNEMSEERLQSEEKKKRAIPLDVPFDQVDPKALSPTGISVEEIKALGDFPDYATLSGVPLPQPYNEFDISKALPRPYRPIRWAYHQTMCKLCFIWDSPGMAKTKNSTYKA